MIARRGQQGGGLAIRLACLGAFSCARAERKKGAAREKQRKEKDSEVENE